MRSFMYRFSGIVLVISAIVGVALSGFGIWGAWELKPRAEIALIETTQIVVDSIDLAYDALEEVAATLQILNEGLQSVNNVKDNLAEMLTSITPVLDRTSDFVGEDLVGAMSGLQGSLETLEYGMQSVENALSFINRVPLIGHVYSTTSTSMTDGVGEMSDQVSTLSSQFGQFQEDLAGASDSLDEIQSDVETIAQTVDEADLSLQRHLDNVDGYLSELSEMRQEVLDFRAKWLLINKRVAIGITVVLSWVIMMMIGLTIFSSDLAMHGDQRQQERENAAVQTVMIPILEEELRPQLREEILAELRQELGLVSSPKKEFSLPKGFHNDHE